MEDEHPATLILKDLFDKQEISEAVYKELLAKFNKVQIAFRQSCDSEQNLMKRARELNKELKAQKQIIQDSAAEEQEHRAQLATVRQAAVNTQVELESVQQLIEETSSNTELKQREFEKLKDKVTQAKQDQTAKTDPKRKQLQQENSELEESIRQRKQTLQALKEEKNTLLASIEKAEARVNALEAKRKDASQKIVDMSSQPLKMRQKSSIIEATLNTLLTEEKSSLEQMTDTNAKLETLLSKEQQYQEQYDETMAKVDKYNDRISKTKKLDDGVRGEIEAGNNTKLAKQYELKQIEKDIHERDYAISQLTSKLEHVSKEVERKREDLQKLSETVEKLRTDKAILEDQLATLSDKASQERRVVQERNAELRNGEMKKEEALKALVVLEQLTAEVMTRIEEEMKTRNEKKLLADRLEKQELEVTQQLQEAALIRARKGREVVSMRGKVNELRAAANERNMYVLDLIHMEEDLQTKMKESAQLYDHVKTERNHCVNTIQTSKQLIVELLEKIKLLKDSADVLEKEYVQIESLVRLQKNELTAAWHKREATKGQLKRAQNDYRALEKTIDHQANETERMSRLLQRIEDQIITQQGRYTIRANECMNMQQMLADRHDELCLIYEQYARHQHVMQTGEKALKEREEELKMLNLQLADFARRIETMQKRIPELQKCDTEIVELENQINEEQNAVNQLAKKLEEPDTKQRTTHYSGKDISNKELDHKVSLYEERLKAKDQQKSECEILLRDLQERIDSVRSKQTNDDVSSKVLEKNGNIRAKTIAARRKKKAALSEMAVYQAQTGDLQDQKLEVVKAIGEAEVRTARGEAFDAKAERIARMHERDIKSARNSQRKSVLDSDDEDEEKPPGRPHYDAYPTSDGLSRPYGAYPVFQPAPPSSNLRYYKKEGIRPVVV